MMFLDTLVDDNGDTYEYGHCYSDDNGTESGCGMEYMYYASIDLLVRWHDGVGLETRAHDFSPEAWDDLIVSHADHCA